MNIMPTSIVLRTALIVLLLSIESAVCNPYPEESYKQITGTVVGGSWHAASGSIKTAVITNEPPSVVETPTFDEWHLVLRDVHGINDYNRKLMTASFRLRLNTGLFRGIHQKLVKALDNDDYLLLIFRGPFDKRVKNGSKITLTEVVFQSDDGRGSMRYSKLNVEDSEGAKDSAK